jgi:integrase
MLDTEIKIYPSVGGGFTVAYVHPFNKRRIREQFTSKGDAETYRSTISRNFSKEIEENPEEMLLSDWMIHFLKDNPKTELMHSRRLFSDFCDTFGAIRIKDITADPLRVWMNQLQSESGYKDNTMAGIRSKVNIFFRYLIQKKAIAVSPLEGITYKYRGIEAKKKRIFVPDADLKDLAQKAKEYSPGYFYPVFLAFIETAAKTDEIIELKWDQVDFKRRVITFPKGETLDNRSIPISPELLGCLLKKKPMADVVFTNMNDRKFRKRQLTNALLEFKAHFGIRESWRLFDLRHSFAREFLTKGGDIRELKRILGHRSVHTTIELYGEFQGKRLEAISLFDG